MQKNEFLLNTLLVIFVCLFITFGNLNINKIYATSVVEITDDETINTEVIENENIDSEKLELMKKEELIKIIREMLQSLREKVKAFDEKIDVIKSTDEYINYPAIRLNVDTPLFGLSSMVDSKLKITKDVSAQDVANGYSIKTIIKNGSIKLPESKLGSIVISTKEVKFDENISLEDANIAILKLIQYEQTLNNIDTFIDTQINKFFKGYIPKDKEQNIENISIRLDRIDEIMKTQDVNMLKLEILNIDENRDKVYNLNFDIFFDISEEIKKERLEITNMLVSYEDITDIQKRLVELETTVSSYSKSLDEFLKEWVVYDELEVLKKFKTTLNTRLKNIQEILDNSIKIETIEGILDEVENEENLDINSTEKLDMSQDITTQEIKLYDVVSTNIIDELKEKIKLVDDLIHEYEQNYYEQEATVESKTSDGDSKNTNISDDVKNENTQKILDKRSKLLENLSNIYKEYVFKENKFYTDNINMILVKNTNIVSEISGCSNVDLIEQMKYIYISLPDKLQKSLENTDMDLSLEIKNLSNDLNVYLKELFEIYIDVNVIYEKINEENLQKGA